MENTVNVLSPLQHSIKNEIATALINFGAKSDLMSIIGSWGDTLHEDEILEMLKEWNSKNQPQHQ